MSSRALLLPRIAATWEPGHCESSSASGRTLSERPLLSRIRERSSGPPGGTCSPRPAAGALAAAARNVYAYHLRPVTAPTCGRPPLVMQCHAGIKARRSRLGRSVNPRLNRRRLHLEEQDIDELLVHHQLGGPGHGCPRARVERNEQVGGHAVEPKLHAVPVLMADNEERQTADREERGIAEIAGSIVLGPLHDHAQGSLHVTRPWRPPRAPRNSTRTTRRLAPAARAGRAGRKRGTAERSSRPATPGTPARS